MSHSFEDLSIVRATLASYERSDSQAFKVERCSFCDASQMAVIAHTYARHDCYWLRCINCGKGSVVNSGSQVSPAARPLHTPRGLPELDEQIWNEVRDCLSVGASTAAVMLCRKLLVHIAVAQGLPAKNANGYAPNFQTAVTHLETEGLITRRMLPWVKRIKDVGNEANHEIARIDKDVANDVALFTEQLLKLTYEMDDLMNSASKDEINADLNATMQL